MCCPNKRTSYQTFNSYTQWHKNGAHLYCRSKEHTKCAPWKPLRGPLNASKGWPIRSCLNPSLRRLHHSGYMKKIAISYLRASFSIVTAGPLVLWTLSMGQKKANIRIYGRSALYFCSLFNNDSENGFFDFHS